MLMGISIVFFSHFLLLFYYEVFRLSGSEVNVFCWILCSYSTDECNY